MNNSKNDSYFLTLVAAPLRQVALLAGIFSGFCVSAQEEDEDQLAFELNPFEVVTSDDVGYRAANSTAGTALNMAIRDIPISLDVVTRDFMDDTQAADLEETLRYSGGVYTESFLSTSSAVSQFQDQSPSAIGNLNDPFQNNVIIRGYNVPNQQRNGFRIGGGIPSYQVVFGGSTDTITVERSEVVRGPQSLLYGINVLSGIVNIIGKKPLPEYGGKVNISAGSYDLFRAEADFTGPIIKDRLNFRLMGAHHEEGSPIKFLEEERDVWALQFDWKITKNVSLFVEYFNGDRIVRGLGPQFFEDDGSGGLRGFTNFRNIYGEYIQYGRDDPNAPVRDAYGTLYPDPLIENPNGLHDQFYADYGDRGRYYNVSGPDTYRKQNEQNVLALLQLAPTEDLAIELGAYRTDVESRSRNVDMRVFADAFGAIRPDSLPPGIIGGEPAVSREWRTNPEVARLHDIYQAAQGTGSYSVDSTGYWIGEAFALPQELLVTPAAQRHKRVLSYNEPQPGNPSTYTRKFATYSWYETPFSAESTQLRARATYEFETDFGGISATHNVVGGYSFIEDEVSFVQGGAFGGYGFGDPDGLYNRHYSSTSGTDDEFDQDPVYFRESVLDLSPLRYEEDTVLARPGTVSFNRLPGLTSSSSSIARSGWFDATVWYRGTYAAYQGQFWNDKLTLIAGIRRDGYQVKEREQLMILDRQRISDRWVGNTPVVLKDEFIGYGDRDYVSRGHLPDALNDAVAEDVRTFRENRPNGTIEHLFPETQKFTTKTGGFSWRVTDPVSIYAVYSEGIFPNTGQRDGNDDPIGPEETRSYELGTKFELWGGKLSGTLSAFVIERENAVYYFQYAPAPALWHGGSRGPANTSNAETFAPQLVNGDFDEYPVLDGRQHEIVYGISLDYVERAFEQLDIPWPVTPGAVPSGREFEDWARDTTAVTRGASMFLTVPYEELVSNPQSAPLVRAFDLAFQREPVRNAEGELVQYHDTGLRYWSQDDQFNNASEGTGANVLFEERGVGIDGQLVFSPTDNYQILFSFSHIEREVVGNGFTMVDAVSQQDGQNYGTEYDVWVYVLGRENFEDPTRASTFTGGSVRGLDLSGTPSTSLRFWNKYSFREGVLRGFAVGGGVQWNSSVATSTPIGGTDLVENRYPTPDLPSHYELEAMLSYSMEWQDIDWRFQLNVRNLLDDNYDAPVAEYVDYYGTTIYRRAVKIYDPREFRFSVSARF
jgi:outer membrane receptor for ferric coprogen and ferric-rhodotorulic acid